MTTNREHSPTVSVTAASNCLSIFLGSWIIWVVLLLQFHPAFCKDAFPAKRPQKQQWERFKEKVLDGDDSQDWFPWFWSLTPPATLLCSFPPAVPLHAATDAATCPPTSFLSWLMLVMLWILQKNSSSLQGQIDNSSILSNTPLARWQPYMVLSPQKMPPFHNTAKHTKWNISSAHTLCGGGQRWGTHLEGSGGLILRFLHTDFECQKQKKAHSSVFSGEVEANGKKQVNRRGSTACQRSALCSDSRDATCLWGCPNHILKASELQPSPHHIVALLLLPSGKICLNDFF